MSARAVGRAGGYIHEAEAAGRAAGAAWVRIAKEFALAISASPACPRPV